MANMLKVIVLMLCINIMLYLGGFTLLTGDILQEFFTISGEDITGISSEFVGTIPTSPDVAGITTSSSDFRFTDIPKTIFAIFAFLINIMFAPLAILTSPQLGLPNELKFMLGIPLTLIMLFVIVDWWRGGSD